MDSCLFGFTTSAYFYYVTLKISSCLIFVPNQNRGDDKDQSTRNKSPKPERSFHRMTYKETLVRWFWTNHQDRFIFVNCIPVTKTVWLMFNTIHVAVYIKMRMEIGCQRDNKPTQADNNRRPQMGLQHKEYNLLFILIVGFLFIDVNSTFLISNEEKTKSRKNLF